MRDRQRLVRIGAQIAFAIFALLWTYPLTWAILSSLKSDGELLGGGLNPLPKEFHASYLLPQNWHKLPDALHVENFGRAWFVSSFDRYFLNSVIVTAFDLILVLAMSCLAGYVLGRYSFPGKKFFLVAYTLVAFLPEGYTIVPIWYVIKLMGLQNSLAGMTLAVSSGGHLLYILLFTAFFAGLPRELEEAAQVDGAGFLRTFTTVMLPLAKPALATVTILELIRAWNDFFMPLVFSASRPDLQTIAVGLYANFTNENTVDLATMMAGIVMAFIPVVVVFLLLQRYFVEGIAGAVKS